MPTNWTIEWSRTSISSGLQASGGQKPCQLFHVGIYNGISEVNQAAGEMAKSSSQVRLSADELSKLAERLNEMAGRFKL